jgi:hypothetical protein
MMNAVNNVMDHMMAMVMMMDRAGRSRGGEKGGRRDNDRHGGEETTHREYSEVRR